MEECNRCGTVTEQDLKFLVMCQSRDLQVLAVVGRMYLNALNNDPENENLTLPEAYLVTQVTEAVERVEQSGESNA